MSTTKQIIKLLKFNVNPHCLPSSYIPLWLATSSLVLPIRNHAIPPSLVQFQILSSPSHKSLQGLASYLYLFEQQYFSSMNPWANSSHTTMYWILDSHHPDDVITICSCSPSDPDLSNIYRKPSAEELQHLACNTATKKSRQTRSLTRIRRCHKLCKMPCNSWNTVPQ